MRRTIHLLAGLLLCCSIPVAAQENCFNALDDDGDGLFDLNDTTDCVCINSLNIGGDVSLIPNPSFEETDCLPQSWSELSCATGWEQATQPTSDYFNSQSYYPAIFPQPVPDGDGLAGGYIFPGWQEYLGACLTNPMVAGEDFSITFDVAATTTDGVFSIAQPPAYGPIDITIFGLPNCVPFPVNTYDCPVGVGWTELGSVNYTPSDTWSTVTISFTAPFDVETIILGSPCNLPPDYVTDFNGLNPYFLYDNLQLGEDVEYNATIDQFYDAVIDPSDGSCTIVHTFTAHPDTITGVYQWYQEGVALIGQNDTILDLVGSGLDEEALYQFYYYVDDTTCVITEIQADIPEYPGPEMTMDDPDGCAPHAVSFTNSTPSTEPMICEWSFSNGGSSLICDPTEIFDDPGFYDVTLTITFPDACPVDTTYANAIEVFEIPVAAFTTDTIIGCIDLPVQFTNTSTGPVASGVYDFGDGSGAPGLDVTHTYTTAGTWDVQFTVTSPGGCVDDTTMLAIITSVDSPTVLFTSDTTAGCQPLAIQFTNNTDPAYVASCEWSFTGGGTSAICDALHTFTDPGVYTVTLTVTTPWGCSGSATVPDMITVHALPVPSFTAEPDSGCYPLEVMFTNTSTGVVPDGCAWTFGDGAIAAPCDPVYTYDEAGVYDVWLRVTSPEGCLNDTLQPQMITVFDHPVADFGFGPQPTNFYAPQIMFFDSSSADAVLWEWAFGEGGILGVDSVPNPVLTFPGEDSGVYPVQLIVTNAHGCVDTTMRTVLIDGYYTVYVPNTFTPDADGVNDFFMPVLKDYDPGTHMFAVYDRWGERIFETNSATDPWDGTVGGAEAKQDVYVWQVESTSLIDGQRRTFLGHVTLIR